jgi:hypothetical protein
VPDRAGSAVLAPLRAVFAPGIVFSEQAAAPRPLAVCAGLVVLTIATALAATPYLRAAAQLAGLDPMSPLVGRALQLRLAVITPGDTVAYLVLVAGVLWTVCALMGQLDVNFRTCAVIVFVAGVTQVLRRTFALAVLWLRHAELAGASGNYEVWTGLDIPFEVFRSGSPVLVSVARHVGLFEVWFVVLLVIGLVEMARVKVRSAALTAAVTYGLVVIGLVTMDLVLR